MFSNTAYIQHQRSVSGSKKFTVKSTRPSLPKSLSSGRLQRPIKPKSSNSTALIEDLEMVTTFHQFCATCEKQIAVPNSSILYCSESCRRRDGQHSALNIDSRPSSHSGISSTCSSCPSPITPLSEYEAFIGRPLISRRKQSSAIITPSSYLGPSPTLASVQCLHDGKADMDPTEWKPDGRHASAKITFGVNCSGSGGSAASTPTKTTETAALVSEPGSSLAQTTGSSGPTRSRSEAFLYLSQFHRSPGSFASLSASSSVSSSTRRTAAAAIFDPNFSFARADHSDSNCSCSSDSSDSEHGSSVDGTAKATTTAASSAAPSIIVSFASEKENGSDGSDKEDSRSNASNNASSSSSSSSSGLDCSSPPPSGVATTEYPKVMTRLTARCDDGTEAPQGSSAPDPAPGGLGGLLKLTT